MGLPPRVIVEAPPPQGDDKAVKEAAAIASGSLKRSESREKHFHIGGLCLFWFMITTFIVAAGIWLFHLLSPNKWHFLDAGQFSNLQNLLIASVGSTYLSDYAKRILKRGNGN